MKNKNSKARMQIIFGALLFTLDFIIELYGMMNYPEMFIILAVIAGVDLVFLFVMIDGLMELSDQKKERQEEQYDSVFKSEKASYLMQKKYFEEIEDKLNYLEKAAKIPTEEIINAQKGIAKVIINRNHENTDALMNAYDQLLDEVSKLKDRMGSTEEVARNHTEEILEAQKNRGEETEKVLQNKLQDLMVSLKDMELRLNNVIMQSQKVVTQMPVMSVPMSQYSQQTPAQATETFITEPAVEKSEPEKIPEPVEEESEPEKIPEPVEEEPKQEKVPETPAVEPEVEVEPVVEEKPPMPDLSDPNKTMSPDEIAALFANMGGSEPSEVPKPESEPETLEEPEVKEEPAEEEKPPMPDLSDPNKTLSPDEIAALFANMGA